jgi:hypothetical protein
MCRFTDTDTYRISQFAWHIIHCLLWYVFRLKPHLFISGGAIDLDCGDTNKLERLLGYPVFMTR